MKTSYRTLGACITFAALFTQYGVQLRAGTYGGFAATTIGYFSYFTVLTNLLVGLAFTAPLLKPGNKIRHFFEIQAVRAAITLYIAVVMIVYWAVLAPIHNPVGISAVINVLQHLIIPLLYIFDWLVFSPKDKMSYRCVPLWIVFPVLYGIYTIIRGSVTGGYPYPFLNVTELGLGAVFVNMLGFAAFYALGGAGFIALGRRLGSKSAAAGVRE